MKNLLFFTCITLSTLSALAQDFEGKLTYSSTYKNKNPQVSDEQLTAMMGVSQEYYIKEGNYKTVMNGSLMEWQLYINKENKLYTKVSSSPAALWNDGSINSDSIISVKLNKNTIEVLGYTCDELIFTCTRGIQKYYFNTSLKVSPPVFENHKFGNWYDFVKRSNALPLKMIIDTPEMTISCEATQVTEIKLDASNFQLPADMPIQKSPY